jgi:hypothetical protein
MEIIHAAKDNLLIAFINDAEIEDLFWEIGGWYA